MSVEVRLPRQLRELYGLARVEMASGATVDEVFADLDARHPGLRHRLVDAGALRRHIIVFVGDRQGGLDTAVTDAGEVTIVAAVAGG